MRNPAGLSIGPKGDIWTTDNQVDGLGDDIPPGELNKLTKPGEHFGFPYYNGHFKVAGSPAAADLKIMKEPPVRASRKWNSLRTRPNSA
jgi:glucose/arabinose dehydrogenase